ncbi:Mce protein [Mycobacterium sp. pUA109]|uniref:Mce protein n=1 Tax=Mycobacterium sp. pUA109 TaxID=3238982 RepID=UPI00351B77E0
MAKTPATDVFDRLAEDLDEAAERTEVPAASEDQRTDTPADDAAEPADQDAAGPADAGQRPRRRRAVLVLVAGIVVASLGLSGFLGWRLYQVHATTAAGAAALAAAKSYALVLTTLDSKSIDDNYAQAIDGATGEFKEAYGLGSAQLRQTLIDNNAAGKGVVIDAAVKSATKTKVEVLLFVDQSITNSVRSEPRIDRNRIQMTMELVDGRWLASKVDLV